MALEIYPLFVLAVCVVVAEAFTLGGTWAPPTPAASASNLRRTVRRQQQRLDGGVCLPPIATRSGLRLCSSPQLLGRATFPFNTGVQRVEETNRARIINADQPFPEDSDFRTSIECNYCYVDRTQFIKPMLRQAPILFLRPRRFGKSLWLSALKEFFSGDPELFKGLAVYGDVIKLTKDFTWCPTAPDEHHFPACPVIHLDFSQLISSVTPERLDLAMQAMMIRAAGVHGVRVMGSNAGCMLERLVLELAMHPENKWRKVVVLIDEYDAVWANFLHKQGYEGVCGLMQGFMSVLKSMAAMVEFTFVTGIAPVALTGYFNDPNALTDLSLHPSLATLCGFTQTEVEHVLESQERKPDLEEVRRRYNGYSWDTTNTKNTVYNPFVIRKICDERSLENFWAETSSDSVVNLLNGARPELALPMKISEDSLVHAKMSDTSHGTPTNSEGVLSFMYHGGCATIKNAYKSDSGSMEFELDYPNEEVRSSIAEGLFKFYGGRFSPTYLATQSKEMVECLYSNQPDVERFFQIFNDILATTVGRHAKDAAACEGFYETFLGVILRFDPLCEAKFEAIASHGDVVMVIRLKQLARVFVLKLKATREIPAKKEDTNEEDANYYKVKETVKKRVAKKGDESKWTELAEGALEQIESNRYEAAAFASATGSCPEILKCAVVCDSKAKRVALIMDSGKQTALIPTKSADTKAARQPANTDASAQL